MEKVLLSFEYNPENCPFAIAKVTPRLLETTKVLQNRMPDLKVQANNKSSTPISANDLFYKHSVQIFQSPLIEEISSVCHSSYFKVCAFRLAF